MKTILKNKTNNQVNVIHPYRSKNGIWAFDDEEVGLEGEPFVGEINTMIDILTSGANGCTVYLSKDTLPSETGVLTKQPFNDETLLDEGWYGLKGTEMKGWLCPALLKYFSSYPDEIHFKIENVRL